MLHNKTAFGNGNDNYLNMTIEASPVKSCILLLIGSIEILFNESFQYLIGLTKAFTIRIQSRDRKKNEHAPILYGLCQWKQSTNARRKDNTVENLLVKATIEQYV